MPVFPERLRAFLGWLRRGTSGHAPADGHPGSPSFAAAPPEAVAAVSASREAGDLAQARRLADALIAQFPDDAAAGAALAMVLLEQGDALKAADVFEALARRPEGDARAAANAIEALRRAGRSDRALELARGALAAWPDDAELRLNVAMALRETGQGERCIAMLREALRLRPDWPRAHASLLFTLTRQPVDDALILPEHRAWGAMHADALPRLPAAARAGDPGKVLNVAYVSGDFCAHAISYFTAQLFERHDRGRVRVIAYSAGTVEDAVTARYARAADRFVKVAAMGDAELAARIQADGIDVLVDLSGHTRGNRLLALARHPAPVQLTWLGYPYTTGMQAMDYRLTDGVADPPGVAEQFHCERLLRLPRTQWCYEPPADAPLVSPLPALQRGHVTFGVMADFHKLHPALLRVWAGILRALPAARLLLLGVPAASSTDWIYEAFEAEGIALERITLRARTTFDRYLAAYGDIDIGLDTFPYNGATTTCESLWMGVPVVSLAGSHGARRSGASLLDAVGLADLAASSESAYLNRAVALAGDLAALGMLRAGLRARMRSSPLMDGAGFARDVEDAYRLAWQRHVGAV